MRLTPSTATEPFSMKKGASAAGKDTSSTTAAASRYAAVTVRHGVHVPEDKMAAEAVREAERPLQVHARPGPQGAQRRPAQRLRAGLHPEAVRRALHHREAGPVNGNGLAEREVARAERGAHPQVRGVAGEHALHGADVLDEPGKHVPTL